MKGMETHFEFETFKTQIEKFVLNEIMSWEKIGEKPFAIFFKPEIYHKIREIYAAEHSPIDATELFGLRIGIRENIQVLGAYTVDKKTYFNIIEEEDLE